MGAMTNQMINVGDKVYHARYHGGEVKRVLQDNICRVAFAQFGTHYVPASELTIVELATPQTQTARRTRA